MRTYCFHWNLQRLRWKPLSPIFPLTFCRSRDTGAHQLKMDIIWIATVHCSQNTFNDTLFCDVGLVWLIDGHYECVTVSPTHPARVLMSWWGILNLFWDVIFYVSEIVSAETWTSLWTTIIWSDRKSVWHTWVISAAVALWLTQVLWIQWTLFPRISPQPILCSFRDTHHSLNPSFKMVGNCVW